MTMKDSTGFYYLATPYANYPGGPEAAYRDAVLNASTLIRAGISVFSPIVHCHHLHPIVQPNDAHRFWLNYDRVFMDAAKGLIVCKLSGWATSRGVAEECEFFEANSKPIIFMAPGTVPVELNGDRS